MKKLLITASVLLFFSCSKENDVPPNLDGTRWDFFYYLDPPGSLGFAEITFNENGTVTTVPATAAGTWSLSQRNITIEYPSVALQYKGQLKGDTLMSGTIYKAGNPGGNWSATPLP